MLDKKGDPWRGAHGVSGGGGVSNIDPLDTPPCGEGGGFHS